MTTTVEFNGGSLHGQLRAVRVLTPVFEVMLAAPLDVMAMTSSEVPDPDEVVCVRRGTYRLARGLNHEPIYDYAGETR